MAHQHEGADFLVGRRCGLLAFEQGLGKTLVAIEAFLKLRARREVDLALVICPNSLKRTWAAELARFAPEMQVCIVEGGRRERRRLLSATRADAVVINYESARNEIVAIRAFLRRRRAALILDESHNVKNARSLNNVAAQHFAPLTQYRWLLSGTPVTNAPVDIYPQLCLVAGGHPFGSYASFEAQYGSDASPQVRAKLAEKVRPYLLRRTKEECLDLPDKTFVDIAVELPLWQRRMYEAMRDDLAHEVEGMSDDDFRRFVPTALTRLLRLSQIASNPALLIPGEKRVPGKFAELDRIVDELVRGNRRKVILWSYYVHTLDALAARYAKYGAATLYGKTEPEERQRIASRFQDDPELMVLLANPAAAGTGFTLTAANYTIYETLTWRYDLYAQSQDRNHRIGQRNPVTYIRLIAEGTIEQAIVEALERKAVLAGEIVGDDVAIPAIQSMTAPKFKELLSTGRLPTSAGRP